MKPVEGVALGGRYRLVSRIAVGGMGEVWKGHDEALARDVAVKVLREEFAGDAGFLERFRTEARNCAQLSHPNIAQLYDYGEQDGSGFLVMELVLGEPMSDLLDRQPQLPTRRLLPVLSETARALHAAHVAGVVHRDVKPGNILLARSGRVKITDFGISTTGGQVPMTASGMVMGTAQYLSPEQAIGKAATPASDIYSLGIVAYEALAGNRPFTGATAVDIAVAHVNKPVPPLPGDVDPDLAELVLRMLAKEPEERPRSAASLARVLDDMLARTPPSGVPTTFGRHARAVDVLDSLDGGEGQSTAGASRTVARERRVLPATGAQELPPVAPPTPGPHATPAGGTRPVPTVPATGSFPPAPVPLPADPPGPTDGGAGPTTTPGAPSAEGARATSSSATSATARTGTAALPEVPAHPGPERASGRTAAPEAPAEPPARPRRASTTTGRRWGRWTRPLLALVLMVVFALLGAAFADSLWGPSRASGPADGPTRTDHDAVVATSLGTDPTSGMIGAHTDDPPGAHPARQTTTARNL